MSKVSIHGKTEGEDCSADDRRRSKRADLRVQVRYSTIDEMFSEFTRDINEGGIFIQTEKPDPPGTEVSLLFSLPGGGDPIETTGRVVRVSPGDSQSPPGMGVEFDELGAAARAKIDQLVRELRLGLVDPSNQSEPD